MSGPMFKLFHTPEPTMEQAMRLVEDKVRSSLSSKRRFEEMRRDMLGGLSVSDFPLKGKVYKGDFVMGPDDPSGDSD